MSRARHKAMGGNVKPVWNAGEGQMAAKEAMEKKKGGAVQHGEGHEPKARHDRPKRARGGKVEHKAHGGITHHARDEKAAHHMRKHKAGGGRLRGEGAGADRSPLTTASKVKHITSGETPEEGIKDGGV